MSKTCNRRQFLKAAGAGLAGMSLAGSALGMGIFKGLEKKDLRKMNVLFIAVDDLRPQLGCYGQKQIISPNIDRLAREGLIFDRAYCQQAVCGPSRASLMSGLRPDSIGAYEWYVRLRDEVPDVLTLPQHFKNNGYETMAIGKIYHHYDDDFQGFTKKPYNANRNIPKKDRTWFGHGYVTEESRKIVEKRNDNIGRGPAYEMADVDDEAYADGVNAEYAIKELNRLKDKPFFLAAGFYKPHLPFSAPKKYWDLYDPEKIELPDNMYFPKDAPKIALTNWGELRHYPGIPKEGDLPEDLARTLIHGYYACVSYTDALVGKLLDELDRLGLRDNTIVILWGDHGWKLGEHNMWCKHTNYELDTHVPMMIRVPGMKTAGQRTDALTEYVDIYPTLCELCNLELPKHLEGHSMVKLIEKPDRPWKKAAFSQYPRGNNLSPNVMGYTMRTDQFRYTEWRYTDSGEVMARELYDHKEDPAENVNVVNQPEYADDIKRLEEMMKLGWRRALPN
jgi:arylsulfatase A-like enzyme